MNDNTVALIVGGSSGMGKAVAEGLVKSEHNVIITGRDRNKLDQAKSELEQSGTGLVSILSVDLYDSAQVTDLIEHIKGLNVHISQLVNAAGYFKPVSFLEHSLDDYNQQMDINRAFFFISQAVGRNMQHYRAGSVVNIGSMWAHQAVKATPSSAYSMQKAGLHSLTQHMAMELSNDGIRVNAVAPAVVLSDIYQSFIPKQEIEQQLQGFNDFHPLGRIGNVQDVANAVLFLLSDKASWIKGTVMNVDGGVMAGRN